MRFLYQYPERSGTEGHMLDAGPLARVATAAEDVGWSGISFTEHPAPAARWLESGGHQTLDPFVALGHVASVTSRIRLVTYISVLPYRNPFLTAKAAATVDILSGGRMVLGVGTGYLKSEFHALGVEFGERNALFDEVLDALRLHWSGEPFSYQGTHFSARDVVARPAAVQQPIPIWIGGNAAITLRRVAERAQGWMPLSGPVEAVTTARTAHVSAEQLPDRIRQLREMAGDRADGLDVVVAYHDLRPDAPGEGSARHRERFAELEAAGATWISVVGATADTDATLRFLDEFGEAYCPGAP